MIIEEEEIQNSEPLIPGLPDDIAKHCLLHLPYPYHVQIRSVSRLWNRAITDPSFLISKNALSLSLPFILVLAFRRANWPAVDSAVDIQWQALDPRSGLWFILPPMPCPFPVHRHSFACVSLPRQGLLFVLGSLWCPARTALYPLTSVYTYRIGTNRWSTASRMQNRRSFCAAGTIGGKIFAAGGIGTGKMDEPDAVSSAECYDPAKDTTWVSVEKMRFKLAAYDAAVVSDKMYVTGERWWPPRVAARGNVYDAEKDTWEEMSSGMRRGWTGKSVALGDRLFMITEHGSCRLKVYVPGDDTWQNVGGGDFPCEPLKSPFAVCGAEGKVYVVSGGLDVAIGSVSEREERGGDGKLWVEWEVVRAPKAFKDLDPSNAQVLYA